LGNLAKARFEGWAGFLFSFSTKKERHPPMDYLARANRIPVNVNRRDTDGGRQAAHDRPTVLVATVDSTISDSMRELLQMYPLRAIWAKGIEEVRAVLATENVRACFCGFWLVDGTYRDVVRLLKHQALEIPAIVVCEPACPHEYRDYLAALNIRAFDFICHPYRRTDMDRILRSAISERSPIARHPGALRNPANGAEDASDLRRAV
jgi:DNA-binding NtrC family response regulator